MPAALVFAASPAVYPPVDRTTGGPTGSSLLGSALVVVGLMLLLPRVVAGERSGGNHRGIWIFFGVSWVVFGVTEAIGGTHHDAHQIGIDVVAVAMGLVACRMDWAGFAWPDGSRVWRMAMFGWWGLLVVSGLLMYQPGVLDRLKFTQGLVAHSHLAMAGFTTSFCALLVVLLTRRRLGGTASVAVWHLAALVMIATLALMGWREGAGPSWMHAQPGWRECGVFDPRALRRLDVGGFGALVVATENPMKRVKFLRFWSIAVGSMDALTGLLLVIAPEAVLRLLGSPALRHRTRWCLSVGSGFS